MERKRRRPGSAEFEHGPPAENSRPLSPAQGVILRSQALPQGAQSEILVNLCRNIGAWSPIRSQAFPARFDHLWRPSGLARMTSAAPESLVSLSRGRATRLAGKTLRNKTPKTLACPAITHAQASISHLHQYPPQTMRLFALLAVAAIHPLVRPLLTVCAESQCTTGMMARGGPSLLPPCRLKTGTTRRRPRPRPRPPRRQLRGLQLRMTFGGAYGSRCNLPPSASFAHD